MAQPWTKKEIVYVDASWKADKPIVVNANRIKFHGKGSGNVGPEVLGGTWEPAFEEEL